MKKTLSKLMLMATIIVAGGGYSFVKASAAPEFSGEQYLRLQDKDTGELWLHRNNVYYYHIPYNFEGNNGVFKSKLNPGETIIDRNVEMKMNIDPEVGRDYSDKLPIIFFDTNPKWNLKKITKIYFEISDGVTGKNLKTLDLNTGEFTNNNVINSSDKVTLSYYEGKSVSPKDYGTRFKQEYRYETIIESHVNDNDQIVFNKTLDKARYSIDASKEFSQKPVNHGTFLQNAGVNHYRMTLPKIGKMTFIEKYFSMLGAQDDSDSLLDSTLFRYRNSKINSGFDYDEAVNKLKKTYEYYLILPPVNTNEITINYLSFEGYDAEGKFISPDIPIEYEGSIGKFNVSKVDKKWAVGPNGAASGNAIYFPGQIDYTLKKITLTAYIKEDETVYSPVIISLGKWIGEKDYRTDPLEARRNMTNVSGENEYIFNYVFQGDNNVLIVDIPLNVITATVEVTFEKNTDILTEPFYINLLDDQGKLGQEGGIGEMIAPKTFLEKIGDFFNDIKTAAGYIAMGIGLIILLLLLTKYVLLPLLSSQLGKKK